MADVGGRECLASDIRASGLGTMLVSILGGRGGCGGRIVPATVRRPPITIQGKIHALF